MRHHLFSLLAFLLGSPAMLERSGRTIWQGLIGRAQTPEVAIR